MPRNPNYVKERTEYYNGWKIKFKVQARSEDGLLKTHMYVSKKNILKLIPRPLEFRDKADNWVASEEKIQKQIKKLRQTAKEYIDNVQTGENININGNISDEL